MSVINKLIFFLIGCVSGKTNDRDEDQRFIYSGYDRAVMLESVKLILTKGTFLLTKSGPGFRTDLFLFDHQYVEIGLCRNAEAPIRIVIISGDSPEMNNYLELIRIDELAFSSHGDRP